MARKYHKYTPARKYTLDYPGSKKTRAQRMREAAVARAWGAAHPGYHKEMKRRYMRNLPPILKKFLKKHADRYDLSRHNLEVE